MQIAGIDYGSKMAGTTVIATQLEGKIHFFHSERKKDADRFIQVWAAKHRPNKIFIDAPLSLPAVYISPDRGESYFFRKADRALNAMSPMFLGGLTARAMQLRARLREDAIEMFEVYPRRLAKTFCLEESGYKKKKTRLLPCLDKLHPNLPYPLAAPPATWHHFDALLAFISGWRYQNNLHQSFGDPTEGVIIV